MKQSKKEQDLLRFDLGNIPGKSKAVLALGAELKANYCLIKGKSAYLRYGFDDLKTPKCLDRFRKGVLKDLSGNRIDIIACDLNPAFFSSRFARELHDRKSLPNSKILRVQHHFAHVAGAWLALGLRAKKVIGIACDGTGWGADGRVWGCEFIISDLRSFERVGHLGYFALPGGDKAVFEPWRTAFSLLYQAYGKKVFSLPIPWIKEKQYELKLISRMIDNSINSPLASSAGRLFDAVAALTGICLEAKAEAQAPMLLEEFAQRAGTAKVKAYQFSISSEDKGWKVDASRIIKQVAEDVVAKESKEIIARRFHLTFSEILTQMCVKIKKKYAVRDVVLCGGVFFNKIVLNKVRDGLTDKGFRVSVPPALILGDAGLSLGQAVMAYVSGCSGKD